MMGTSIVGIGASAGGLEALKELLDATPVDTCLAFVIVQHMARSARSMLPELLAAHTSMPVLTIEPGQCPAANSVYVMPPGYCLSVQGGVFELLDIEDDGQVRKPIDIFFNALAADQGDRAYALVLSGTGSDGTIGITAIKAAGGIAIAQRGDSARFSGMPDSAVATGLVDFVLAPRDMPQKLMELEHFRGGRSQKADEDLYNSVEAALPEILGQLAEYGALTFHHYKPGTLIRRILRRMILKHADDVAAYQALLRNSPEESKALVQDFLIGVTQFFRNPEAFAFIRKAVLPELLKRDQREFRVWIPGCSTGEEVFSLAMLIRELQDDHGDARPWKIFGTDIDLEALATARRAVYAEEALAPVTAERRARFFNHDKGYATVSSELRNMCVFAPHNVLSDPPFSKMDLVSCRNLMIYIDQNAQEDIVARFHYALNPKGFLWLGPSESLSGNARLFELVNRNARVFRREASASSIRPPFLNLTSTIDSFRLLPQASPTRVPRRSQVNADIEMETEQAFLSSLAPPFARISRYDEVLYASEAMRPLLRPAKGVPSAAVGDYFVESLRMPLRLALKSVRQDRAAVEVPDVIVEIKGELQVFDVRARPLDEEGKSVLVAFQPVRLREPESGPKSSWRDSQEAYETELALARKRLTARERDFEMAEQELRAGNEELLTMNEELQSTNEELETSREELQSVNEELETINSELIENNKNLNESNSNIKNLLESTDIATLFVDQTGSLRLFTPRSKELFALQDRDLGRPIFDLSTVLEYPDLKLDLERAKDQLQTLSREVETKDGSRTFLVRLKPYQDVRGRIDGAVTSFIEITEQRLQELRQREISTQLAKQVAEMEAFTERAPIGVGLHGRDMRYIRVNQYLADTVGLKTSDMIGQHPADVVPEIWKEVGHLFEEILATGEPKLNLEVTAATPGSGGQLRTWIANYFPISLDNEGIFGIGVTALEVTKIKRLEAALETKRRELAGEGSRILAHFEQAPIQVVILEGRDHVIVHANKSAREAFGDPDPTGKSLRDISREHYAISKPVFDDVYRSKRLHIDDEIEISTMDKAGAVSPRMFRRIVQPYIGADDEVIGLLVLALDITEIVRMREAQLDEKLRLDTVISSLETGVVLLDREGRIVEANSKVAELHDVPPDTLLERPVWDLAAFQGSQGAAERLRAAFHAALEGGNSNYLDSTVRISDGIKRRVMLSISPLRNAADEINEVVVGIVDQTELLEANARKDIVVAELEHRVKNVIATMQAIVRFTALSSKDPEELALQLDERLGAMARTHDQLTKTGWADQKLSDIVQKEVTNHLGDRAERVSMKGDEIVLTPGKALILGLAVHELMVNALKYGALSVADGEITIQTRCADEGTRSFLWKERSGKKPRDTTPGFGTLLLTKILPSELDAVVGYKFTEDGLVYELKWRS